MKKIHYLIPLLICTLLSTQATQKTTPPLTTSLVTAGALFLNPKIITTQCQKNGCNYTFYKDHTVAVTGPFGENLGIHPTNNPYPKPYQSISLEKQSGCTFLLVGGGLKGGCWKCEDDSCKDPDQCMHMSELIAAEEKFRAETLQPGSTSNTPGNDEPNSTPEGHTPSSLTPKDETQDEILFLILEKQTPTLGSPAFLDSTLQEIMQMTGVSEDEALQLFYEQQRIAEEIADKKSHTKPGPNHKASQDDDQKYDSDDDRPHYARSYPPRSHHRSDDPRDTMMMKMIQEMQTMRQQHDNTIQTIIKSNEETIKRKDENMMQLMETCMQKMCESTQNLTQQLLSKNTSLQNDLSKERSKKYEIKDELREKDNKINTLIKQGQDLHANIQKKDQQIDQFTDRINLLLNAVRNKNDEITQLRQDATNNQALIQQRQQEVTDLQNKINRLRNRGWWDRLRNNE